MGLSGTQLPTVSENRRLLLGTYVAERRSKEAFELLAAATPRRPVASARGEAKKRTRKFDQAESPALPALSSVDALLGTGRSGDAEEDGADLLEAAVPPYPRRGGGVYDRVLKRLYPGRGGIAETNDMASTAPGTAEYREWLTMPRVEVWKSRQGQGAGQKLQDLDPIVPGFEASPSSGSRGARGSTTQPPTGPLWHIVLLQSTFKNDNNTPGHVVRTLEHILKLNSELARKKVSSAETRRTVDIVSVSDSSQAFQKAEMLRKFGLNVQVVSEPGLPCKQSRAPESNTYTELFRKCLRGTAETIPRGPPPSVIPPGGKPTRLQGTMKPTELPALSRRPSAEDARKGLQRMVEKQMDLNHMLNMRNALMEETPPQQTNNMQSLTSVVQLVTEKVKGEDDTVRFNEEPDRRRSSFDGGSGLSHAKKEACQMLRFFIYGKVGNEFAKTTKEKEAIFNESQGTHDQVISLFNLWGRLDEDGSGRVDIFEFRNFAEKHMKQRLEEFVEMRDKADEAQGKPELSMFGGQFTPEEALKFTSKLCDRLGTLVLGKKSSFVVEDMMRTIWPAATVNDMKDMWQIFSKFKKGDRNRIKTPPLLPEPELDSLFAVFRFFDSDHSGEVMLEELVDGGLIYEDSAAEMFRDWDRSGDGKLDMLEFAEMMCPAGYRAHPKARLASLQDGTYLIYDGQLDCWRIRGSDVLSTNEAG